MDPILDQGEGQDDLAEQLTKNVLGRFDLLTGSGERDGISDAKFKVLTTVDKLGPVSIGKTAKALGVAQSTTSEMIVRLIKAGLVEKARATFDERIVMVDLTAEGRRQVKRRRKLAREALRGALARLSEQERQSFLGSLKTLDGLVR